MARKFKWLDDIHCIIIVYGNYVSNNVPINSKLQHPAPKKTPGHLQLLKVGSFKFPEISDPYENTGFDSQMPLTKNNVSRYIGCTAFVHSLFNSSSFSADNNYFEKKARSPPTVTFRILTSNWFDYSSFKTKKIIQLEYTLIFKHIFEKCCKAFASLIQSDFFSSNFSIPGSTTCITLIFSV